MRRGPRSLRPARGRAGRGLSRLFSPLSYLRWALSVALLGGLLVPALVDVVTAARQPIASEAGRCRILSVIDGDTVTLACEDLGVVRARLQGLDAPEKYSPRCAAEWMAAERAGWALRGILMQAETVDLTLGGRDRYDRVLVSLRADGEDVARQMIRAGHARAYGGGLRGSWC